MKTSTTHQAKKASTAISRCGMISTASAAATEAGVKMLKLGGNAVDAAAAAAFCLGVTEPQASGLGGQSMILLYRQGADPEALTLDGSSRAPYGIDPQYTPAQKIKVGIQATTVPSTPAALGYLLETYGTFPLDRVLEPAIEAAEKGYKITALQHRLLAREASKLLQDEQVKSVFFKNGQPLNARETAVQPQLADCLKRISREGWRDFYVGVIAREIIKDMECRGGLISQADLNQIPYPVQRDVLKGCYRGRDVYTFPPPGAGWALVHILKTLEAFEPWEVVPPSPLAPLILAMVFRAALMCRERMPVDPALFPQVSHELKLDRASTEQIAARIRAVLSYRDKENFSPPGASGETTHLSAADAFGNTVAITQSIELLFGAKTMARGLGFFYNNYMSAFQYKDMMHPFFLLPGGRPWSSAAPTLLFQDGRPFLALGSPGSERISTSLAQVITRVVDAGQDLWAAIEAPRLHAGSSGKVLIEKRFSPEVMDTLQRAGFTVTTRGAYSYFLGCVQAVMLPEPGRDFFYGVSDPRRDGAAGGPQYLEEVEKQN